MKKDSENRIGGLIAPLENFALNRGFVTITGWVSGFAAGEDPSLVVRVGKRTLDWPLAEDLIASGEVSPNGFFQKTFALGKGPKSLKLDLVEAPTGYSHSLGRSLIWQKDRVRLSTEEAIAERENDDPSEYETWLSRDQMALRDVHDLETSELAFPVGITWIVEVFEEAGLLLTLNQLVQKFPESKIVLVDRCGYFVGKNGLRRAEAFRRHPQIVAVQNDMVAALDQELSTPWLGFLRSGDAIEQSLADDFFRYLGVHPETKFFYTDHDLRDDSGRLANPCIKPAWNRDLLSSDSYIGHAFLVETQTCLRAFRGDPYAAESYWALQLAITRSCQREELGRLCGIYFHLSPKKEQDVVSQLRPVLEHHYSRLGLSVELSPAAGGRAWHASFAIPTREGFLPKVSLLIPTRDGVDVLAKGIDSILDKTNYPNFEVLVLDNESEKPETFAYFEKIKKRGCRIIDCPGVFNYSRINNRGSIEADGEFLAFLNNDLEVIDEHWLREMVGQACRQDVGAVGAKLLYPNGSIQHTGVLLGVGHVAAHAYRLFKNDPDEGPVHAHVLQNFSAVTAACLVVRRSLFLEVGGFDDVDLPITNNDVDLCIKIREAGYRNIYTPRAVLFHHESATRGPEDTPEKLERYRGEVDVMWRRWHTILWNDPAYNRLLTRYREDYSTASETELDTYKPGTLF
jgi:GT2 family glycosyltransferase